MGRMADGGSGKPAEPYQPPPPPPPPPPPEDPPPPLPELDPGAVDELERLLVIALPRDEAKELLLRPESEEFPTPEYQFGR